MIQVMVACSVVCTVFILNFHERTVDTHEVGVRNLKNHMKTLSFFSDASLGGVYFPPVVALASQDGSTRTTLDCEVNPAQVFKSFLKNRFYIFPRQRLWQLDQGDKPAHPGLVTPGKE